MKNCKFPQYKKFPPLSLQSTEVTAHLDHQVQDTSCTFHTELAAVAPAFTELKLQKWTVLNQGLFLHFLSGPGHGRIHRFPHWVRACTVPGLPNQAVEGTVPYCHFFCKVQTAIMEKEKEGRSFGIVFIPPALPRPCMWLWVKSGMSHCQLHEVISPQEIPNTQSWCYHQVSKTAVHELYTCLPTPSCKAGQKVTVTWPHQAIISYSLSFKGKGCQNTLTSSHGTGEWLH